MPESAASDVPFGHAARQVGKMMEQLQKGFFPVSNETWNPSVNLYETETHYIVCVDLAGMEKDHINLSVEDNQLRLRGSRPVPTQQPCEDSSLRCRVHLMEIDHGPFCREVQLPQNVDQNAIEATYRNGMLWIELPKR